MISKEERDREDRLLREGWHLEYEDGVYFWVLGTTDGRIAQCWGDECRAEAARMAEEKMNGL